MVENYNQELVVKSQDKIQKDAGITIPGLSKSQ